MACRDAVAALVRQIDRAVGRLDGIGVHRLVREEQENGLLRFFATKATASSFMMSVM